MVIEIQFQRTSSELWRAWLRDIVIRKHGWLIELGLIVSGLAGIAEESWVSYLSAICLGLAVLTPFQIYMQLRNLLLVAPFLVAPTTARFSQESIEVVAPGSESKGSWDIYSGWSQTKHHYLLHFSRGAFSSVIPKRAFTPALARHFEEMLAEVKFGRA